MRQNYPHQPQRNPKHAANQTGVVEAGNGGGRNREEGFEVDQKSPSFGFMGSGCDSPRNRVANVRGIRSPASRWPQRLEPLLWPSSVMGGMWQTRPWVSVVWRLEEQRPRMGERRTLFFESKGLSIQKEQDQFLEHRPRNRTKTHTHTAATHPASAGLFFPSSKAHTKKGPCPQNQSQPSELITLL